MELRRLASAAPTPVRRTFTSLSPSQVELEERLRTWCLCICAAGVVAYGLARLKFALVPLLLSLSLKYVLQPLIDALTGRARTFEDEEKRDASQKSKSRLSTALITIQRRLRRIALPHSVAVFVALWITLSCLALLAAVVAESVRDFTSRADEYAEQVKSFLVRALRWLDNNGIDKRWRKPQTLEKVADRLELSSWVTAFVFSLGEGLLSLLSTTALVVLFTLYLLLTPAAAESALDGGSSFSRRVDRQIDAYIKGKLALSLLVGCLTALLLAALHVDLWLAFAVVAFFANFVPNLGAVVAIALPMPVVIIGPESSPVKSLAAFALLVLLHAVMGNVVEPILFGKSMKLHPVVVLLSLMIWGFIWGVPGLVLAVPMTAILRIYLASVDHPLAALLATILDGGAREQRAVARQEDAWSENIDDDLPSGFAE